MKRKEIIQSEILACHRDYCTDLFAVFGIITIHSCTKSWAKTALMAAGFPKFKAEKWSKMVKALESHFEKTT